MKNHPPYVRCCRNPASDAEYAERGDFMNKNGFTLIEILIAIFIFAIIVTTIFGSFNAVFSHSAAIREGTEIYEMARNCIDRMMTDLEAIYFPMEYEPKELGEKDPDRIEGKDTELRF
ncbi:MAG: prepilin-type N-terminal cleavage/methylation domain-containing protein, partial [Desulfobacteraceae bacterium]|nr:prepilin-type N-terminal cleavage/methylation domain-containing protein [Desulfobacteraceae bacterium]